MAANEIKDILSRKIAFLSGERRMNEFILPADTKYFSVIFCGRFQMF